MLEVSSWVPSFQRFGHTVKPPKPLNSRCAPVTTTNTTTTTTTAAAATAAAAAATTTTTTTTTTVMTTTSWTDKCCRFSSVHRAVLAAERCGW